MIKDYAKKKLRDLLDAVGTYPLLTLLVEVLREKAAGSPEAKDMLRLASNIERVKDQ